MEILLFFALSWLALYALVALRVLLDDLGFWKF